MENALCYDNYGCLACCVATDDQPEAPILSAFTGVSEPWLRIEDAREIYDDLHRDFKAIDERQKSGEPHWYDEADVEGIMFNLTRLLSETNFPCLVSDKNSLISKINALWHDVVAYLHSPSEEGEVCYGFV